MTAIDSRDNVVAVNITEKQEEVLRIIRERERNDLKTSYADIGRIVRLSSTATKARVSALQRKGFLMKDSAIRSKTIYWRLTVKASKLLSKFK